MRSNIGGAVEARQPQIEQKLGSLEGVQAELVEAVTCLRGRLQCVLLNTGPQDAKPGGPPPLTPNAVPLAARLEALCDAYREMVQEIRAITERVELPL